MCKAEAARLKAAEEEEEKKAQQEPEAAEEEKSRENVLANLSVLAEHEVSPSMLETVEKLVRKKCKKLKMGELDVTDRDWPMKVFPSSIVVEALHEARNNVNNISIYYNNYIII